MEKQLKDYYQKSGISFSDFKEENQRMAGCTKDLIVRADDVTLLSLCNVPEKQIAGKAVFYILSPEYLDAHMNAGAALHIGKVAEEKIGKELINEMRKTTGLMALIEGEKYLISQIAMPTLTTQAMVSGTSTINRNNLYRDLHIADALFARNERIHFVYREVNIAPEGQAPVIVKKIFAALGRYFTSCPQTIISDVADLIKEEGAMGEPSVRAWQINQEFTELYLEFPDVAEDVKEVYKLKNSITPGLYMCTSDTGSSSFICRGVYSTGRGYVITEEVSVRHSKKIAGGEVLEDINKEVFANVRKLPEAMAELIGVPVTNPLWDLTTEDGNAANYAAVADVIERVAKDHFKKILPAKRLKSLTECMKDEINSELTYTMYDVALTFLEVSDRLEGLDATTLTEMKKAASKVPFNLVKKSKVNEEPEEEIYLMPS